MHPTSFHNCKNLHIGRPSLPTVCRSTYMGLRGREVTILRNDLNLTVWFACNFNSEKCAARRQPRKPMRTCRPNVCVLKRSHSE
jgi:hypothetical protein